MNRAMGVSVVRSPRNGGVCLRLTLFTDAAKALDVGPGMKIGADFDGETVILRQAEPTERAGHLVFDRLNALRAWFPADMEVPDHIPLPAYQIPFEPIENGIAVRLDGEVVDADQGRLRSSLMAADRIMAERMAMLSGGRR